MAGTIVTDRIESDASYASSVTVASPMIVANTISMSGAGGTISGNVNFDSGTLFVDSVNNRVGVGTQNPGTALDVSGSLFIRGSTNPGTITNRLVVDYNGTSGLGTISANSTGGDTLLAFGTSKSGSNATRMTIDSDGRVTMPYQPAFTAYKTSGNESGSVSPVIFNVTHLNNGSHYNTSTGRFTAPVAGMYYFFATVDPISSGSVSTQFMKNGSDVTNIRSYAYAVDGCQAAACVLSLAVNDYVSIRTNTGVESVLSHFTGYLIG